MLDVIKRSRQQQHAKRSSRTLLCVDGWSLCSLASAASDKFTSDGTNFNIILSKRPCPSRLSPLGRHNMQRGQGLRETEQVNDTFQLKNIPFTMSQRGHLFYSIPIKCELFDVNFIISPPFASTEAIDDVIFGARDRPTLCDNLRRSNRCSDRWCSIVPENLCILVKSLHLYFVVLA